MKLKDGFVLHSIGDEHIVVPINERTIDFHGMIKLNKSGAYLWGFMKKEFTAETLTKALLDKYDVTEDVAEKTADDFIKSLEQGGILEN